MKDERGCWEWKDGRVVMLEYGGGMREEMTDAGRCERYEIRDD